MPRWWVGFRFPRGSLAVVVAVATLLGLLRFPVAARCVERFPFLMRRGGHVRGRSSVPGVVTRRFCCWLNVSFRPMEVLLLVWWVVGCYVSLWFFACDFHSLCYLSCRRSFLCRVRLIVRVVCALACESLMRVVWSDESCCLLPSAVTHKTHTLLLQCLVLSVGD